MQSHKQIDIVSTWSWIVTIVLTRLPLVNLIVVPFLALVSSNPSKRNFYRANVILFLALVGLILALVFTTYGSSILDELQKKLQEINPQESIEGQSSPELTPANARAHPSR